MMIYKEIWDIISKNDYILLVSHKNPDGDTVGSVLALYDTLKNLNKRVYLYNATKELPRIYDFLPNINKIKNSLPKRFDLIVACDCGSFDRLGLQDNSCTVINIDHHKSNDNFGDYNLVESSFASTGEIIYKMLNENGIDISKDGAICLYASIAEDSGFFRYPRVNEKTFKICSDLVLKGASPSKISYMIKGRNSLAKMRLLGYMYNNFELYFDARVSYLHISREVFSKTGARVDDAKNMAADLLDMVNVRVAVISLEKRDGSVKVSIRSKEGSDISSVSKEFGGGGHSYAAGFEIKNGDMDKLKFDILNRLDKIVKE